MSTQLSNEHSSKKEEFFNYSYGRYFSNGILVLTSVVLLAGLFLLSKGVSELSFLIAPGFILTVLGFAAYFPTELFQIDNLNRTYRVAFKIGSYLRGDWKKIGEVQYLSIINSHKAIYVNSDIIKEYRLRLYIQAGYTIDVDDYKSKESAIVIGKIISRGLDLKLLDATQRPPVFIA